MTIPTNLRPSPPSPSALSTIAELSKARLSALVTTTTTFGFLSFGPSLSLSALLAASLGTALCASSAATFNQLLEAPRDRLMKRTAHRPLAQGTVSPRAAVALGCLTGSSGALLLGMGTDAVTTALGVTNIALYAGLYTFLKPRSETNTWIGAVVGAIPPVMGWTAAGGSLMDAEAILLGSTLFLWQFPHFFALNWMHRVDYARAGFAMVAVRDPGGNRTAALIKRYTLALGVLPCLSWIMDVTSPMFAVEGIVLNGYAWHVAKKFDGERTNANARKVFLTSLWYLPCVMLLSLVHSRRWHDQVGERDNVKEEEKSLLVSLQKVLTQIQSKGREFCIHEAIASNDWAVWVGGSKQKTPLDGTKCPISVGKVVADNATASLEETLSEDSEMGNKNSQHVQ